MLTKTILVSSLHFILSRMQISFFALFWPMLRLEPHSARGCSEGKTFRLIKRHHCLLCNFLFKASLPHMTQVVLALQLHYLWNIHSIHCYLLWAYFIWDLCYIPCGKFPIKHISLIVVIIFRPDFTLKVCSANTGIEPISRRYQGTHLSYSLHPLHK